MLSSLGLSLAEYARYSHLLYFPPLLFCLIGHCSRRWSLGAEDPRCRPPQREDPRCRLRCRVPLLTRSSLEVTRQEASPFRSLLIFVLAFLRQPCILVSVLRYYLLPLTCALELLYSSPRGPWLVLNSLYYFICRVVL